MMGECRGHPNRMPNLSRRQLLSSALASAALSPIAACSLATPRIKRVRVGLAGIGATGWRRLAALLRHPDVDVVALADPDASYQLRANTLACGYGPPPRLFRGGHSMIERGGLDAVVIATPDHWHASLAIAATAAGQHVFIEMPASHGIEESAAMVAAARHHGRLVQAGMDARSHPGIVAGMQFLHGGGIGALTSIDAINYRHRAPIGVVQRAIAIPNHIDYDVWAGPARKEPLRRRRLHQDWRYHWSTGNGELGEGGTELLDLARWALGYGRHAGEPQPWPERVWSCAGRLGIPDDGETPNTMLAGLEFGSVPLLYRQRGLPNRYGAGTRMDRFNGVSYGVVVRGEEGVMLFRPDRGMSGAFTPDGRAIQFFRGRGDNLAAFVDAVQQRRELQSDIELGRGRLRLGALDQFGASFERREAASRSAPFRRGTRRSTYCVGRPGRPHRSQWIRLRSCRCQALGLASRRS